MVALYWSANHPDAWVACLEDGNWVQFPAEVNGWAKRHVARYLDPLAMRRVPGSRAFNTGFPATGETEVEVTSHTGAVLDGVA